MKKDALTNQLQQIQKLVLQLKVVIFAICIVLVYGFIVLRIQTLGSAQPTQSAVASQTIAPIPKIDPATVNKINQLQDNSVSAQALFNQARQDPFAE